MPRSRRAGSSAKSLCLHPARLHGVGEAGILRVPHADLLHRRLRIGLTEAVATLSAFRQVLEAVVRLPVPAVDLAVADTAYAARVLPRRPRTLAIGSRARREHR